MTQKTFINTDRAPSAIGTYSQAVKVGNTTYISGQIPLNPATMTMVTESFDAQAKQVFDNLNAIVQAAGGDLNGCAKLTILLSDMAFFPQVNDVMSQYFQAPYPARAAYAVKSLPKDADIEVEAILITD